MLKIILHGSPRTKKNSQRIVAAGERRIPLPSKAYEKYEEDCLKQITGDKKLSIDCPVNLKCLYYMPTRHKVDLVNLLEATCDILVKAEIIADDNSTIIKSHDGSRVLYDKENPRVEIEIRRMENE